MSDLEQRNIDIMIQETQRMHAEVEQLRTLISSQRADFTTLMNRFAQLERTVVMETVKAQVAEKGHGGTA